MRRDAIKSEAHKRKRSWEHCDYLRTQETGGSIKFLEDSFISLTIPVESGKRFYRVLSIIVFPGIPR
jgi:hypothetical protein